MGESRSKSKRSAHLNGADGRKGTGSDLPVLVEVAWEVCNQLGGIYTVLRSKAPSITDVWADRYVLVGPYDASAAAVEFEPEPATDLIGRAVETLRRNGLD